MINPETAQSSPGRRNYPKKLPTRDEQAKILEVVAHTLENITGEAKGTSSFKKYFKEVGNEDLKRAIDHSMASCVTIKL